MVALVVRLVRDAKLLAVVSATLIAGLGCGGGGGGDPPPAPSLAVTTTTPTNGATGVSVTTPIAATYSENLASTPALTVTGPGGVVVAGAVARSGSSVAFAPLAPLSFGTTYVATVSGASGANGASQSGATSWSFTTVAAPATPPAIALSTTTVLFSGTLAGANPAAQTVSITNAGGGTLSGLSVGVVTYGAGATGWLQTATLNSSAAPATLILQPTIAGLPAGTFTATVPVAGSGASNSPRQISVSVTVAAPTLTLIGTNPVSGAPSVPVSAAIAATFSEAVANTPSFTLTGSAGAVAGAITRAGSTVTFTPSAPLANSTTYTATITGAVGASGATQASAATWSFTTAAAVPVPPSIALSAAALSFNATAGGSNPLAQVISVTNSGGGSLTGLALGTISYGAGTTGWLQSPALASTSAPTTFSVQPTISGLAAGTYTATVPVTAASASNSPQSVSVTLVVAPGATATIAGTVEFQSVPSDTTSGRLNYANTFNKPVRGATVQVLPASGGAPLATGVTSSAGTYSLSFSPPQPVFVRVLAEMVKTSGAGGQWNFTVRDNTQGNALYAMDSGSFTPSPGANTQNLVALTGWGGSSYTGARVAARFAILDVVYDALQKVTSASPNINLPALRLFWSPNNQATGGNPSIGFIGTTKYTFNGVSHEIYILGDEDSDTDEFDRTVVAHEFGHYLQSAVSRDDSVGGQHSSGNRLDMRVAFSEGWGNAWSGMALATQYYTDSFGAAQQQGFRIDLAASPTSNRGWFSEGSVQYLMYQWHSNGAIGFPALFGVMTGLPASAAGDGALTSIHHFGHRLKATVATQAPAIDSLLSSQQITVSSPLGAGEANDGGVALALPVYKSHTAALGAAQNYCVTDAAGVAGAESNKLGAQVYIRFSTPSSGTRTINVVANDVSSNPRYSVYRSDGARVGFESGTGASRSATLSLAAGTHLIVLYDYNLTHGAAAGGNTGTRCFDVTVQ